MMKNLVALLLLTGSLVIFAEEPEVFGFSTAANLRVRALENYNNALQTEVPGESIKLLLQSIRENPANDSPCYWLIKIAVENKTLNETGKQLLEIAAQHPEKPLLTNIALDMALYGRTNPGKQERIEDCNILEKVLAANDLSAVRNHREFLTLLNLLYRYNFLAYDKATYLQSEAIFNRYYGDLSDEQKKQYAGLFLSYYAYLAKYKDTQNPFWHPWGQTPYEKCCDRLRSLVKDTLAPSPDGFNIDNLNAVAIAIENLHDLELLKEYEKALVDTDYLKDPNNANTLAYLKSLFQYDLDGAERLASFAVLQENNAAFWDTMAWVYFQQKKYDKAKECIQKALVGKDLQLGENTICEHAGDIYAALGDADKAKEFYRRALESDLDVRYDKTIPERKLKQLEQQ